MILSFRALRMTRKLFQDAAKRCDAWCMVRVHLVRKMIPLAGRAIYAGVTPATALIE